MNYDFQNLSPYEFELLTRDLLQKEFKVRLESFKSGKDQGIDLRYSISRKKTIIIQCKRYATSKALIQTLKKELKSVKKLSPSRYVISTSAGLSPADKTKIKDLFQPYIKNTGDILGQQDLNNLLGKYPEIEKQHFKLWLSSTNVLQSIINSKIINQSTFELEEIEKTIKLYVENDSYSHALDILKDNRFVIISGIPGIGKTTLARVLTYHFLSVGMDEFVYLSESISEGFKIYNSEKKQVFLFDDFLGRNFLQSKLSTNEEKEIIKFINKVKESDNKILIFTTREYILQQAKAIYDLFDASHLDTAKCIIDLSDYTKMVRARILYNHLYFSNIDNDHITNILDDQGYLKIINHKNYNPRIIEKITDDAVWNSIPPEDFLRKFLEFLEYPESVWKHVFENQIDDLTKSILIVLFSCGTPIYLNDLQRACKPFILETSGKKMQSSKFSKAIRELENTFIITKREEDKIIVDFQNPSVQDFMSNYIKDDIETLESILSTAIFFNQFFKTLTYTEEENKIKAREDIMSLAISTLLDKFDELDISTYRIARFLKYHEYTEARKVLALIRGFDFLTHRKLKKFILDRSTKIINKEKIKSRDTEAVLEIIKEVIDLIKIDEDKVFLEYFNHLTSVEEIKLFAEFKEIFGDSFTEWADENFEDIDLKIYDVLESAADDMDPDDIQNFLEEDVSVIKNTFDVDLDSITSPLEDKLDVYNSYEPPYDDEGHYDRDISPNFGDDYDIENMFEGFEK